MKKTIPIIIAFIILSFFIIQNTSIAVVENDSGCTIKGPEWSCMDKFQGQDCITGLCPGPDNIQCCKQKSTSNSGGGLQNPLPVNDIPSFMGIVIRGLLGIVGTLSLAMFIYGGFLWITSGGNEDAIKKGKNTIMWAILGIVIIFTSYAILNFVLKIIGGAG